MRRLSLTVVLILFCSVTLSPTPAGAQGDSAAVAVNTHDGMSLFRLMFSVRRTMQEVVDIDNAAVAISSCTDCQTVAVAIQAVLIFSDPAIVTTDNLALALNLECSSCETLASAYQWVMTTGGVVHFTAEGQRALAEIRRQVLELLMSDLSIEEIQAQLDPLMDQMGEVLANELVAAGPSPDLSTEPAAVTPSPSETESASPPPTYSATPSPSPTPTETTSPSPTAS